MENNNQLEPFDINQLYLTGAHPTSTVSQSRLPAFSGVKKSNSNKVELIIIENSYGTLTYEKCRLTQRHRDILDWIFSFYREAEQNGDGSVTYSFNPYAMLKDFGHVKPDIENLRTWIKELRTASITVETKKFKIETSIITEHGYNKMNNGQTTKFGDGHLYQITISRRFMQFFENDLHIFYNKLLPDILKIKSAEVRAIVRFLITQKKITKKLEELLYFLDVINNGQDKSNRYKTIRLVRNFLQSSDITKKIGISIDKNDIVSYVQHEFVYFKNPA